ncbi:cytochrome c oxidase accessory protein CcoG [Flavipsychrobacter stenotrophus]|uniref:Cytochrome c oxidase accessory protein CcoG n=1 Tax=Flavipsychrobacter stenotrophus TaxID=2077091 RepID=A0A2S7SY03_9BACT|nr:cytochrome c oxidase accessory protein CcoG [Flavipsychrobacter stenotrophus]PQJ11813.1 cytochrome c oxidase accessory protein CcoG [Flavipsychrobacter stenotrophus]
MSEQIDIKSSFRDKVATIDKKGKRVWIFAQQPKGRFYTLRTAFTAFYLLLFFGLPFLKYKGHPLFLINILERKFILFGQIFWPQDFFIFALGMIVFIVFIALFTVVFGRVFCGWACPQTIFMEMVFRRIEYLIEGTAAEQKILERSPWDTNKILRKGSKWLAFWMVSFLIANTFLSYIIGVSEMYKMISESFALHVGTFVSLVTFTTVFFFVYLWMREQICTVICPYGRMQGVLLDRNSMIVAYDYKRGETRAKFRKSEERTAGDCIDCEQCVKVCPTGIDIRNGTQLECVNCTACIDACDRMMEAVNLPKGLIRMASENNIAKNRPWVFTVKMKAYSFVMCLLLGVLVWLLASRTDVGITLLRTPGQLYQEQPHNELSNLYNYKMLNKTFEEKEITLVPENFKGYIKLVGETRLKIPKDGIVAGSMFVYLDKSSVRQRTTKLKIGVYEHGKKISTITTSFLGPFNDGN